MDETPAEAPKDEIAEAWFAEAQRRGRELDDGVVEPISVDEVRRKARALLK